MFERTGVLNRVELEARNEVKWEMYTKKIQIEARVLGDLAINHIIPVATRYQSFLVDNLVKIKSLFDESKSAKIAQQDLQTIETIAEHMSIIKQHVKKMLAREKKRMP